MKYPLAGVCSRDIQCETGHLRYSILKNKTAILFPEPVDNCILNVNFYKKIEKSWKKWLTNLWKGGIIVNVAENNTDTTKTIQKQ